MYKTIAVMLIVSFMFLTGCTDNQVKEASQQTTTTIQESNTFEHGAFSIVLPAPYTTEDNIIQPKKEKDFPFIIFGSSREKVEVDKLLEFTEDWFKILCNQTDACGKIISSETTIIDGKNTVKFTVQYQGRSLEDKDGYLNEYHYSILNGENLFQFWTSASDLKNSEKVRNQFDEIIETILFK